jgi:hypothetical protein
LPAPPSFGSTANLEALAMDSNKATPVVGDQDSSNHSPRFSITSSLQTVPYCVKKDEGVNMREIFRVCSGVSLSAAPHLAYILVCGILRAFTDGVLPNL